MELWQGIVGIVLSMLYVGMTVVIFVFNWGRIYSEPQPPSWQCGFHKLTLLSCIINFVVGAVVAMSFWYFTIGLIAKG